MSHPFLLQIFPNQMRYNAPFTSPVAQRKPISGFLDSFSFISHFRHDGTRTRGMATYSIAEPNGGDTGDIILIFFWFYGSKHAETSNH